MLIEKYWPDDSSGKRIAMTWRPDEAASAGRYAVDLWTSPADRRAPFGACGQPVDNALGRMAIDRAFRCALPTACPHSRASRPQPHSFGNKFFFSKKRKTRTAKRGHFYFALIRRAFFQKALREGPRTKILRSYQPSARRTCRAVSRRERSQNPN